MKKCQLGLMLRLKDHRQSLNFLIKLLLYLKNKCIKLWILWNMQPVNLKKWTVLNYILHCVLSHGINQTYHYLCKFI